MQKSMLTQDRLENGQKHTAPLQESASPVPLDELYQQLHSSPGGLTTEEARKRLRESGPNEPTAARR
jgi:Cation transporter/ATPase, N-terminus